MCDLYDGQTAEALDCLVFRAHQFTNARMVPPSVIFFFADGSQ